MKDTDSQKILLTRPIEQSRLFAADLTAHGIESIISPVMEIKALDFECPPENEYDGVILTSANALPPMVRQCISFEKAVFCVGDQTARAARDAGFENVKSAGGDLALLEKMLEEQSYKSYFYPAGRVISRMPDAGKAEVMYVPVYDAVAAKKLSEELLIAFDNNEIFAAMFFSARSAKIFSDLVLKAGCTSALKSIKALCIRDSVVHCLKEKMWREVHCASLPNKSGMLELAKDVHVRI